MQPRSSSLTLPGAVIIAGAIVAVAIIWTHKPASSAPASPAAAVESQTDIAPVTAADHIWGNPNAPVKIVEYSDPSCPYCKMFQPVVKQIMDQYGPGGQVAWVYRHFPMDKEGTRSDGGVLHPNAGHEAEAFECAASLGGNTIFWNFVNAFYTATPSVTNTTPNGLDQKKLPDIAKSVGLDPVSFSDCVASNQFKDKIDRQYLDGINAGISGTPYSVIITPSGSKIPLIGYVPYNTVKQAIDTLISGLNGAQ
jgi:protein-disulfide isomerase